MHRTSRAPDRSYQPDQPDQRELERGGDDPWRDMCSVAQRAARVLNRPRQDDHAERLRLLNDFDRCCVSVPNSRWADNGGREAATLCVLFQQDPACDEALRRLAGVIEALPASDVLRFNWGAVASMRHAFAGLWDSGPCLRAIEHLDRCWRGAAEGAGLAPSQHDGSAEPPLKRRRIEPSSDASSSARRAPDPARGRPVERGRDKATRKRPRSEQLAPTSVKQPRLGGARERAESRTQDQSLDEMASVWLEENRRGQEKRQAGGKLHSAATHIARGSAGAPMVSTGLKALNDKISTDHRVDFCLLPIGDGVTLVRPR